MGEFETIARIAAILSRSTAGVSLSIGDDAAVLEPPTGASLVWTIDAQVEGVHFRTDLLSLRSIGFRSVMAAASDVAAMGASAWAALSAWTLPQERASSDADEIAKGQSEALALLSAAMVGGNLARGPVLSVTTTFLGQLPSGSRAVQRSGASAGDGIYLSGPVGRAAAGLLALTNGRRGDAALEPVIAAWERPIARMADGLAMRGVATAAIDISDGLAADVGHLANASALEAVLDEAALLGDPELNRAAKLLADDPTRLALFGGEDYAIVAASRGPIPGFRRIGTLRPGEGVSLRTGGGESRLRATGFDHFSEGSGA